MMSERTKTVLVVLYMAAVVLCMVGIAMLGMGYPK